MATMRDKRFEQLAELINVPAATLRKYRHEYGGNAADPFPCSEAKEGKSKILLMNPGEVLEWMKRNGKKTAQADNDELRRLKADKERELILNYRLDNQKKQRELEILEGKLVWANEVKEVWAKHVLAVRTKLLTVATSCGLDRATEQKVEAKIRSCLEELGRGE